MARYTQLQQSDIQKITANYDLVVTGFEIVDGGAGNSSYLLHTTNGKYVLTVCDDKNLNDATSMGHLLLLLEKHNVPATRLLPPVNNPVITEYMNKPVMLKAYIDGQVCENLDEDMLRQVGTEMGQLHEVPAPDFLPDKHAYGLQVFSNVIGCNINTEYESWLAKQLNYLEQNIPPDLPCGLIHGDLFYDNVIFEEKTFRAIIDFEEACHYYKGFDLGMGVLGLCVESTTVTLDKAHALVNGYQQVRKLEQTEKETLQLFVQYAAAATSCWRFWKYHIDTPCADNANKHWQMMQIAKDISNISKTEFLEAVF